MKAYTPGYVLEEDEYLLKIRGKGTKEATGFMTKLNKNGTVPKPFQNWENQYNYGAKNPSLPIYVVKNTFTEGWKLKAWRFGESQNWASVIHPDGYTLEIYLDYFLKIVNTTTIVKGVIQGKFMWQANTLVKFTS